MSEPPPTPPPRPTTRRGKPKAPKVERRGVGTYLFGAVIAVVVLAGGFQLYQSLTASDEPKVGDHIHAALGINVCGTFAENPDEFLNRAGTDTPAGLHTHGDGLIHVEPLVEEEAGDAATVGRYFEYGGWEVDEDHMKLWDDLVVNSGEPCPDGRAASVRWTLNGEEQDGNPSDRKIEDGDVIAIGFLPEGDAIGEPPSVPNLADPTALERPLS